MPPVSGPRAPTSRRARHSSNSWRAALARKSSSPKVLFRAMAVSGRRTALVTGASAGIGLYTALGLARAGFRVAMIGRDPARIDTARRTVAARVPDADIDTATADFSSLDEVRGLADAI